MNKKLLIISPYFPPVNAADMHRVRMSLPYYAKFGWDAEVVTVNPRFANMRKDNFLIKSLPGNLIIHYVNAFSLTWTSIFGLGSIALRSLWFYFRTVNRLLKKQKYDLLLFSTTQFPVLVLAVFWKWKFKIKIVFDMQDPWHSDYYLERPKTERPPKYWFSYNLNRHIEPIAMYAADGLISVSEGYIRSLQARYPRLKNCPFEIIPFGLHAPDLQIAIDHADIQPSLLAKNGSKNIVYIGRGGYDLLPAVTLLLDGVSLGLKHEPETFKNIHIHLIGTSYAPPGTGKSTFQDTINHFGLSDRVTEITDRIPFYQVINTLRDADILFIPGPNQPDYTASKIFPYIMAQKPILAILHSQSNAVSILETCEQVLILNHSQDEQQLSNTIYVHLNKILSQPKTGITLNTANLAKYSSEHYTKLQTELFNKVCSY